MMIEDLNLAEINQVSGGALEGQAATAGVLAAGFAAAAIVPTPASPALLAAAGITTVIGIGIGYIGTVYSNSAPNPYDPRLGRANTSRPN